MISGALNFTPRKQQKEVDAKGATKISISKHS